MKKLFGFLLVTGIVAMTLGGCMRNDDEPAMAVRPISRLYISIGNFQSNASEDPIDNVLLIDPADTTEMDVALSHDSEALQGGAGIYFDPFGSTVFQAGYGAGRGRDTTIRIMNVGTFGVLSNNTTIQFHGLNAMRGIVYHQPTKYLYVANSSTEDGPTIYGYSQPKNRRGYTRPHRVLRLASSMRPWGMVLWGDNLLVSNSADANGGVSLYGGLSEVDSLAADFPALSTVRIEGATSIRGIAFVDSLDVLVAADYGTGTSADPVMDGRIYIIEGIKAKLTSGSTTTVTPTRIIQGALTGLTGPMDVAIDPRPRQKDNERTIFVADYDAQVSGGHPGRILRFRLSDKGNVAPDASLSLDTLGNARQPFGIFLDARGVADSK